MNRPSIMDALPVPPDIRRDGYLCFCRDGDRLEYDGHTARYVCAAGERSWPLPERELPTAVKRFLHPALRPHLADPHARVSLSACMLGGAFNPPTLSHEQLAKNASDIFDIVLVIPAPDAFLTGYKGLTEGNFTIEDRIRMLQLAFRACPRILVLEPDASRTYDTLSHLAPLYEKVSLVVGADSVKDFPNWYRHDDLLRDFSIHVAPRAGQTVEGFPALPDTGDYTRFSSTQVRERIRNQMPFDDMVSPLVYTYLTCQPE